METFIENLTLLSSKTENTCVYMSDWSIMTFDFWGAGTSVAWNERSRVSTAHLGCPYNKRHED